MRISTYTTPYPTNYSEKKESFIEQATKQQEESEQTMLKEMGQTDTYCTTTPSTSTTTTTTKKTKKKFYFPTKYSSSAILQHLAATKTKTGVHGVIFQANATIRAVKVSSSSPMEAQATIRKLKRVIHFAQRKLTALGKEQQLKEQKEMARVAKNRREEQKALKEAHRRKRVRNAYERCNTIDPEDVMRNAKQELSDHTLSNSTPTMDSAQTSLHAIIVASQSAQQSAHLVSASTNHLSTSNFDVSI